MTLQFLVGCKAEEPESEFDKTIREANEEGVKAVAKKALDKATGIDNAYDSAKEIHDAIKDPEKAIKKKGADITDKYYPGSIVFEHVTLITIESTTNLCKCP